MWDILLVQVWNELHCAGKCSNHSGNFQKSRCKRQRRCEQLDPKVLMSSHSMYKLIEILGSRQGAGCRWDIDVGISIIMVVVIFRVVAARAWLWPRCWDSILIHWTKIRLIWLEIFINLFFSLLWGDSSSQVPAARHFIPYKAIVEYTFLILRIKMYQSFRSPWRHQMSHQNHNTSTAVKPWRFDAVQQLLHSLHIHPTIANSLSNTNWSYGRQQSARKFDIFNDTDRLE